METEWSDARTATPLQDILYVKSQMDKREADRMKRVRADAAELKAALDAKPRAEVEQMLAAFQAHPPTPVSWCAIESLTQYLRDGTVPNL